MKMKMFSVYDAKARSFCTPFFCPNEHVAMRSFEHASNDPSSDIGRYPTDFSLYQLGEFDATTGGFDLLDQPLHLSLAVTLVQPTQTEVA